VVASRRVVYLTSLILEPCHSDEISFPLQYTRLQWTPTPKSLPTGGSKKIVNCARVSRQNDILYIVSDVTVERFPTIVKHIRLHLHATEPDECYLPVVFLMQLKVSRDRHRNTRRSIESRVLGAAGVTTLHHSCVYCPRRMRAHYNLAGVYELMT
jgi:hypothetical protein